MTALPPGPMSPNWGQILSSVGAGLSAAGSPQGGWSAFAPAVMNAQQNYQANAAERRRFQLLEQQAKRAQEQWEAEQRTANQEAARREQQDRLWSEFVGPGMMSPQPARVGHGGGLMQTASSPMLGSGPLAGDYSAIPPHARRAARDLETMRAELQRTNNPRTAAKSLSNIPNGSGADGIPGTADDEPVQQAGDLRSIVQALPQEVKFALTAADPDKRAGMLMDYLAKRGGSAETRTRIDGDFEVFEQYDPATGRWSEVSRGPRWQQNQGQGLTERQRNALAAGLRPGTPEYEQYILGRDDNEGGGPFEGNAMDAQASNILLTGNPASPEYAAAYAHLAQPKVQFDPTTNRLVTVSPDLSWAKKPGQQRDGAQTGAPLPIMPAVTGNRAGPTVQSAQQQGASSFPQAPTSGLPEGTESMSVPGATITSSPGTGLSAADRSKIRQIRADADSIKSALTRFKEVVQSSDWRDDLSAYGGGMTEGGRRLNSTYNSAALLTKAESLFNLGVLNGPDLELIRRTLPDPSTLPGMLTSEGASGVAVDEIISLIDNRLASFEAQYGGGTTTSPGSGKGGAPSGGTRVDQLPPGNWQ